MGATVEYEYPLPGKLLGEKAGFPFPAQSIIRRNNYNFFKSFGAFIGTYCPYKWNYLEHKNIYFLF